MTNFIEYKKNKDKVNKDKVQSDLDKLRELDSQDMQLDLYERNTKSSRGGAHTASTIARKEAMAELKKDVRTAYGDKFADEIEKESRRFTPDIFG